ncbi:hypothetical protein ACLOJK_029515 [Asimina triloba]
MLQKLPSGLPKPPKLPTSFKWRTQLHHSQLVTQISSLLLHHQHWITILRNRNLASKLTPPIFFQILHHTRSHPQVSLDFFNWCKKTNLSFKPDLKSHLQIIRVLLQSDLRGLAKAILREPIFRSPSISLSTAVSSAISVCKSGTSRFLLISFLLENYPNCNSGIERLDVFRKIRSSGFVPTANSCSALLRAFEQAANLRSVWCCFAVIIRHGVAPDSGTWVLVCRNFCKEGKLGMAVKLLNSDLASVGMYNLIIDNYCQVGFFSSALKLLKEMYVKKFKVGFSSYSSILDGACKFGNVGIMDWIVKEMIDEGFLHKEDSLDYNLTVQKFCELGRMHAAEMFFGKAQNETIQLRDSSYLSLLKSFAKEGRLNKAIQMYRLVQEKGILMDCDCCEAIADLICEEEPSEDLNMLLKDVVRRGFLPLNLSKYVDALCSKGQWGEAESLLNKILEKGLLPEGFQYHSLIKHHCSEARIDLALALHLKIESLEGCLDVASYNTLLHWLCLEKRIEEATEVFDYMRRRDVLSSEGFSIMITALCHEREMRKAMKMHDEMLQKGLKPDEIMYKNLILMFK